MQGQILPFNYSRLVYQLTQNKKDYYIHFVTMFFTSRISDKGENLNMTYEK